MKDAKEKLQNDIINTSKTALNKIEELENQNVSFNYEEELANFHKLFGQLQTDETNSLLKQLGQWGKDKTETISIFDSPLLREIEQSLNMEQEDTEISIPKAQHNIDNFDSYLNVQKSQLAALKSTLSEATHRPIDTEEDSIIVPQFQLNSKAELVSNLTFDAGRQMSKLQLMRRQQDILMNEMKKLRLTNEYLEKDTQIQNEYLQKAVNTNNDLTQQQENLKEEHKKIKTERQQLKTESLKKIDELKKENEKEQKRREEVQKAYNEKLKRRAERKAKAEKEYQDRLKRLKYERTFSFSLEPYEFNERQFFEYLRTRLKTEENTDRVFTERTFDYTKVFDKNGKAISDIDQFLSALEDVVSVFNPQKKPIRPKPPMTPSTGRRPQRETQNIKTIQTQEETSILNPNTPKKSVRFVPSEKPPELPQKANRKEVHSKIAEFTQLLEKAQKRAIRRTNSYGCLVIPEELGGDSNRIVVLSAPFKTADGKEREFGSMEPLFVKLEHGSYHLIFKDNSDTMLVEASIATVDDSGSHVLVPKVAPIRIIGGYTRAFAEKLVNRK